MNTRICAHCGKRLRGRVVRVEGLGVVHPACADASANPKRCKACPTQEAMGTDAMFMCPGPGCECSDDGEECCCIRRENDQLETSCKGCAAVMRGACAECGELFEPNPTDDELRAELGPPDSLAGRPSCACGLEGLRSFWAWQRESEALVRPPIPPLPPKASPGPIATDGRAHGSRIEAAYADFLATHEPPRPESPHYMDLDFSEVDDERL